MQTVRRQLLVTAAMAAVVLGVFAWLTSTEGPSAKADAPHPGLDFSIASTNCDSSSGSNVCTADAGETVALDFKVNTIGDLAYQAYDSLIQFTEVTLVDGTLVQTGAGVWPSCVFAASAPSAGQLGAACAFGIGANDSTYTGVMWQADFACPASAPESPAVITLVAGSSNTDLLDASSTAHGEGANETLIISCGTVVQPTPTPTPCIGCATDTPTSSPTITNTPAATNTPAVTPTPTFTLTPTATRTPTITPTFTPSPTPTRRRPGSTLGDVDGDGFTNAIDALWVLQYDVGIVGGVPIPEAADMNGDGFIGTVDALFILWVDGGIILPL